MPTLRGTARPVVLAALALASACAKPEQRAAAAGDVVWDTLLSGAVHAVYSSFPVLPLTTTPDLRIGGTSATGASALGDVRGIDVDQGGAIAVLDAQTSELRVFDPKGASLGIAMHKGEGPGQIVRANGLRIDTTGSIWVSDPGRGQLTRLRQREATAFPMIGAADAYVWEGGVTHDGRAWAAVRHPADPAGPARRGPQEVRSRLFYKSFDPATGVRDSVPLGVETTQLALYPSVTAVVPFTAIPLTALDPAGAVWTAPSGEYRLIKQSLKGDTLMVIELPGTGPDLSAEERADEIAKLQGFLADVRKRGGTAGQGSDATDWEATVPKRKPILVSLSVDDQSRLWIQRRTLSRGPVFDILSSTGELLASLDPDFEPWPFFPVVVRGKSLYALVTDSTGVPVVVRAPVPLR